MASRIIKDIHKVVDFIKLDDIVSQCPNCKVEFSVASNENRKIKYCPYCGFKSEVVRMSRIKFLIDKSNWIFPIAIHLTCVGNDNRPYTLSMDVLCFRLIICIDEDSY